MAKVLFVGGREKGLKTLQSLDKLGAEVVWAYILKEDEHEIEKLSQKLKDFCDNRRIGCTITKTIKNDVEKISKLNIDLIVVSGWRSLIPPSILSIPKFGSVALHESLLPKYRGFAPINWAIINGERETGVTLFYLDEGVDNGDIVGYEKIEIGVNETAHDIYKKCINACRLLLEKYYPLLISNKAPRKKQDEPKATYVSKRHPEDGKINWHESNIKIHNLVRALASPYPGAFCFLNGQKIIIQKTIIPSQKKWTEVIPGKIVNIDPKQGVEILTGSGSILVTEIDIDGKRVNPASIFKSSKDILT